MSSPRSCAAFCQRFADTLPGCGIIILASYLAPAPVQSPHLGGFGRPFCPLVEVSAQHFRYKATSSRDCCPNGAHASETKQQDNQEPN